MAEQNNNMSAKVRSRWPLLVLDLDETLVHASEEELSRPCDFRVGSFHVYKRPGLDDFLATISESFQLGIWSSATGDYADYICRHLAPSNLEWRFVWGRERCVTRTNPETWEREYIKDLRKVKRLGFDLNRVLAIDDTRHKVSRNFGNAIYVSPYEGAIADDELVLLQEYLRDLRDQPNYRNIEKRGWRNSVSRNSQSRPDQS